MHNADNAKFKVSVFTGPVLAPDDVRSCRATVSNVRSLCSEKASDWTQMDGDELYDEIGVGYSLGRRTDPRWGTAMDPQRPRMAVLPGARDLGLTGSPTRRIRWPSSTF